MTCSDCEDLQRQLDAAKSYGAEQHHTSEIRWHELQREEVRRKVAEADLREMAALVNENARLRGET